METKQHVTYSRGKQAKDRIMEEIKSMGYYDMNQRLLESGFQKLSQNLSLLRRSNGDVEHALQILNERKNKRTKKHDEEDSSESAEEEQGLSPNDQNQKVPRSKHRFQREHSKRKDKERSDKLDKPKRKDGASIVNAYEEWPGSVRRVFLDGNNMLFVDNSIRKLRLARKQKEAERALANVGFEFAKGRANFHTVLVYDNTKQCSKNVIHVGDQALNYEICSAGPQYKTSDDALVDWMSKEQNVADCLIVTSDRELQLRLKDKGLTHIMKTGNWFRLVKSALGADVYDKLVGTGV